QRGAGLDSRNSRVNEVVDATLGRRDVQAQPPRLVERVNQLGAQEVQLGAGASPDRLQLGEDGRQVGRELCAVARRVCCRSLHSALEGFHVGDTLLPVNA